MASAEPGYAGALHMPAEACVTLRPITPDDAKVLQAYMRGLSPESRYNRFLGALRELPSAELEHVTHLDGKYDLALLAEMKVGGASVVIGEARHAFAPDRLECEFAISVADGWRRTGIGTLLMAEIERRARSLGARRLVAETLRSNDAMKALAQKTGFSVADMPNDARLVRIVKDLAPSQSALRPRHVHSGRGLPMAA